MLKVFRFDASGCNGCDIEILSAVLVKDYGITGVEVVDSPEEAQAMIVTGGGNDKTAELLKEAYGKLQPPKLVIAMGACAASMCVFKSGYPMKGPVDSLIPVNYFVLGCPPRPQNLAMAVHSLLKSDDDHTQPVWLAPDGLRARICLDETKCTACGACANMCPSGAIDITEERGEFRVSFNMWKCSFCGTCQQVCPEEAVRLTGDYALHGAEKAPFTASGRMAALPCAKCGRPHITSNQTRAVRSRVAQSADVPDLGAAEASLAMCPDCKRSVSGQRGARNAMLGWALKH
jgi:Ni,Fe-hydrogenase III small subunit/Pyruvate/2-oxoacid:ferredoxin oxidoreductase delta subunit